MDQHTCPKCEAATRPCATGEPDCCHCDSCGWCGVPRGTFRCAVCDADCREEDRFCCCSHATYDDGSHTHPVCNACCVPHTTHFNSGGQVITHRYGPDE